MHNRGHRASLNYFQAMLKPSRLFLHTIAEVQPFPSIHTAKLHIVSCLTATSFLPPLTNEIFPGTCPFKLLLQRSFAIPMSPCLPRWVSLLPFQQHTSCPSQPGPYLCLFVAFGTNSLLPLMARFSHFFFYSLLFFWPSLMWCSTSPWGGPVTHIRAGKWKDAGSRCSQQTRCSHTSF